MKSINPFNGETIATYQETSASEVERKLGLAEATWKSWRKTSFSDRALLMRKAAAELRSRKSELAVLMAEEMGKVLRDGEAEIEKCAGCCEYFAENAEAFLSDEEIESDAKKSYVAYDPIGPVLAVMPWNFPFWQVFRFAAPSLMAGNVGLLKHASNVSGCALAIEEIFLKAGFPQGTFTTVLVSGKNVESLIKNSAIKAVTLTGSTPAGQSVASIAGSVLKKTVLELGGSDPYIVLDDANLELAIETCVKSRMINGGQSCIAAKRFIVTTKNLSSFTEGYVEKFRKIRYGDPRVATSDFGPMARFDLRDDIHAQVQKSLGEGAKLACGGKTPDSKGAFYEPTVLTHVKPGMTAFDDEIFGPVASIVEAKDEAHAVALANQSEFGLGAAIFTQDRSRAERLARDIEAGSVFVNALVKSDSRLPFGGIKNSGYGRELSSFGIREFANVKTIYFA